jgi:hypothetical protein
VSINTSTLKLLVNLIVKMNDRKEAYIIDEIELEVVESDSNEHPLDDLDDQPTIIPIQPPVLPDTQQSTIDLNVLGELFNQYATLKTAKIGSLILALMAANFAQLKLIVMPSTGNPHWNAINIILIICVITSLVFQVFIGSGLLFLATRDNFIDDEKRESVIKKNNWVTILVVTVSILNIFINIFMFTA